MDHVKAQLGIHDSTLRLVIASALVLSVAFMLIGCGEARNIRAHERQAEKDIPKTEGAKTVSGKGEGSMSITLSTTAFKPDGAIPKAHSIEGKNLSPPLSWSGVPQEAKQLALICDDPDAPREQPWVHWVLYAIPPQTTRLPEGVTATELLQDPPGARQGVNDFKKIGYGGPMPPKGHGTHHYHFKIYALDSTLTLEPGATKKQLLDAMKGHILAQGELIGTYERF